MNTKQDLNEDAGGGSALNDGLGIETHNMIITAEIDFVNEFYEPSPIPLSIRVRIVLNKKGFKFTDDGLFSSVINETPVPIGVMTWYDNYKTGVRHFKQTLPNVELTGRGTES